jgi:hypothetical protein
MEITGPVLIAILLLGVILVWLRAAASMRDLPLDLEASTLLEEGLGEACPPEFVSKIFSDEDQQFVSGMHSPQLEKLFRRERNGVAMVWVRQTSALIRKIMRQHLQASRRSQDLQFSTEARLFLQYAQVRFLCAFLFVSIELLGPQKLRGAALYVHELAQRIGRAQEALHAAAQQRGIHSVGSL